MAKSVEQRLFDAFQRGRGLRLTADEVWALVGPDDAVGTRISNAAADEAGVDIEDWPGCDAVPRTSEAMTWVQFKRHFASRHAQRHGGG